MRSFVLRSRVRFACQIAAIALISGAAAGCSSDWTRFDRSLYSSNTTASQPDYSAQANPYPGDIDSTTTSSVGGAQLRRGPVPANNVAPAPIVPDHQGYNPQTSSVPLSQQPLSPDNGSTNPVAYAPANGDSQITRSQLPAPGQLQPAQNIDTVTTATIDNRQRLPQGQEEGWSATGGTVITLREGETLYNLSRRYGVPANEIMKANGIADASSVRAGQNVVIPTYVYSRNAPISAPDNNARTQMANSTVGSRVLPRPGAAPVPERKPDSVAYATEERETAPQSGIQSVQTSSGAYTVASGDTLTKIAARNGTTVSALMAANNLSGSSLQIGQRLVIPGSATQIAQAETPNGTSNVDPIVTGSSNQNNGPQPYIKPRNADDGLVQPVSTDTAAPEQTGIGQFRWPVRGRVIAAFGDSDGGVNNDGIDISVPEGTAVKATENGVVVYAGDELEGFGNLVLVRHSDGWVSAYAHNKSLEVSRGDEVRRGEIIARSGRTGDANMPKLHFELRKNSTPVDPLKHLGGV